MNIGKRQRVAARTLSVLMLAGMSFLLSPPVLAVERHTLVYTFGVDRSSWFWTKQRDVVVEAPPEAPSPPCPENPPGTPPQAPGVPCVTPSQRQRVRNPQAANTLPVSVSVAESYVAGAPRPVDFEKISAINFGLVDRGIQPGAVISKFILKILEGQELSEFRSYNNTDRKIMACSIGDYWPDGQQDPQEWNTQPPYGGQNRVPSAPPFDESACVPGTRTEAGGSPVWSFDLIQFATGWGEDPFGKNNGVMLVPVLEEDANKQEPWQINLKAPNRDNVDTANNEYLDSKGNLTAIVEFTPAPPITFPDFSPGGFTPPFSPPLGTSPGFTPSAPLFPSVPSSVAGGSPPVVPPPTAPVNVGAQQASSQVPGIVWLLVPVGLIALAMMRSAVLEPAAASSEHGVISAIRRRNVERRGAATVTADPLGRAGAAVSKAARSAVEGLSKLFSRGKR